MATESETKQRLEAKFWEELGDSPFVMLGLQGVDDAFTRPMTAQVDQRKDAPTQEGGQIYFFASRSEDLVKNLGNSHKAIATFAGGQPLVLTNTIATNSGVHWPAHRRPHKEGRGQPLRTFASRLGRVGIGHSLMLV